MADSLNCAPCYDGRPEYDPSLGTAILPEEALRRSRLFAGGTFFRSKLVVPGDSDFQGEICNDIALEVELTGTDAGNNNYDLVIYFEDVEVERFSTAQDITCPTAGSGVAISSLRSQTGASSQYISMPARDTDESDPMGTDASCLSEFSKTSMSGGDGPSEADVTGIRTGPDRTIVFVDSKEDANGATYSPSAGSNLIQWDYDILQWTAYVIDADCALPENRCP